MQGSNLPSLLQAHASDASEGFDVAHCMQIPVAQAKTILKRPRKERQCKALAAGGETTPTPPKSSRSKKLTLQTPMPDIDARNKLGPPPPDSTPTPERGKSPQMCMSKCIWQQLPFPVDLHMRDLYGSTTQPQTDGCLVIKSTQGKPVPIPTWL